MELELGLAGIEELVEKKEEEGDIVGEVMYAGERLGYWDEYLGDAVGFGTEEMDRTGAEVEERDGKGSGE